MRVKTTKFWSVIAAVAALQMIVGTPQLLAAEDGLTPLKESTAYQQYKMRPLSDHSELIFLIDRFADSDIEIVYDGHYYSAAFVGRIARWFLSRHYKKEAAEKWVMTWCNTSVVTGNLIWTKLPGGKFRLAREVLLSELKALHELEDSERKSLSKKNEVYSASGGRNEELDSPSALTRLVAGSPKAAS